MIRVVGLCKSYRGSGGRVDALRGVDFSAVRGRVTGIIGLSGAGKTTLVRCLATLERPDAGSICLNGRDLTTLPARELLEARRRIGLVFQSYNLLSRRTAAANVALPLELAGRPRPEIRTRTAGLLATVGLSERADAYPAQMSGGERQRVAIARALATEPDVLLCDEATAALDPLTSASILELLRSLNHRLGLTLVMVTHQMNVIRDLCDDVAVLDGGRIVEAGQLSVICRGGTHERTRQLLSEVV